MAVKIRTLTSFLLSVVVFLMGTYTSYVQTSELLSHWDLQGSGSSAVAHFLTNFMDESKGRRSSLASNALGRALSSSSSYVKGSGTPLQGVAISQYAYAFFLASCNPDRPSYRGFLWKILISIYILRQHGSTADFVLFLRMAPDSAHPRLPAEEMRWIQDLGARVQYLEQPSANGMEDFDATQMLKITSWT